MRCSDLNLICVWRGERLAGTGWWDGRMHGGVGGVALLGSRVIVKLSSLDGLSERLSTGRAGAKGTEGWIERPCSNMIREEKINHISSCEM